MSYRHRTAVSPALAAPLRWILALAFLLSAAACARAEPGPEATAPGATEAVAGPAEPVEENPVITFAGYEYDRALYEPLMEAFMAEHPDIRVQFTPIPEITSEEEAQATNWLRLQATTADTSLTWGGSMDPNMSVYFRDLGPLVDADPAFDADDFWAGALDACTDAEGRVLGIPLSLSLNGVYYDQGAFDEAGLPYPAPGWTYEDFAEAASALAGQVGGETRYGFADQTYIYGSILGPQVANYLEENGGEIDAEALRAEIQWYLDLAEQEAILPLHEPEDWNVDWEERMALFRSEARPVMWTGGLAESMPGEDYFFNDSDPFAMMAFRTDGFAPFPVDADDPERGTTPVFPSCISMSAGAKNPRAAWTWIDFVSRQSLVRDQNQPWERLQVPARRSLADQVDYWSVLPEEAADAVRFALDHPWFGTLYPEPFGSVHTAIIKTLQDDQDFAAAVEAARGEVQAGPTATPDLQEVVVATPMPPPPEDATVIEYFYNAWDPQGRETFKTFVETYNAEHPGIYIKPAYDITSPPESGDWFAWMGEQYDCFSWYPNFIPDQPPQNLLNLSTLVEGEGPEFIQDYVPEQLEAFRYEGELYGLPIASQPQILAYNADLLEKRGLEPPPLDWTFDDFIELINAAASTSAAERSYGFLYSPWENLLLLGRGARWADLSKDPPEAYFDSPEMVSAMAWLADLIDSGALLVQTDENWATVEQAIREGQVAFWTAQAGQPQGWYFQMGEPEFKVGVAPLPAIADLSPSEPLYWSSPMGHFISSQAEDPQACWEWITFLSEQPEAFPGVPARISVASSPAWVAKIGEQTAEVYRYAAAQAQQPDPDFQYGQTGWPFYTWRDRAIQAILKGEDPEEALSAAQVIATDYLTCLGAVDLSALEQEEIQKEVNRCARQVDPEGNWPEQ
jgi:ABC-type glycerol-3-phosphate transport system substrate-binding protein